MSAPPAHRRKSGRRPPPPRTRPSRSGPAGSGPGSGPAADPDLGTGPWPAAGTSPQPAFVTPRRRRWPAGLGVAAALGLFITIAEHVQLAVAGRGLAGGAAAWALLTAGLFGVEVAVVRWHRPARRAAWRGVKAGGAAGWRHGGRLARSGWRSARRGVAGQPPDWSWVPATGPWQVVLRSRSGQELRPGFSTVQAVFQDRDVVIAELEKVAGNPDIEASVRTVPPARQEPPPAGPPLAPPEPPPAPVSPHQPGPAGSGPGSLGGPARPNGAAGRRAHRRSGGLRIAAGAGGVTTAEWQALITSTADFEPEDEGEFLRWSAGQVIGLASYSEALIELFEHLVFTEGVDPAALDGLLVFADAAADAADKMSQARVDLANFYRELRKAAAEGRKAPKHGHWISGEGEV
jgi:hypothetical protein